MADGDFLTSQILSNIEDLDVSNAYCLYQRRYPRRLPKLDDSPKKTKLDDSPTKTKLDDSPKRIFKQKSPQIRKLKSAPTRIFLEEAMPLKENDHLFGRREKCEDNVHDEVKNLSLEDFQEEDEEDLSRDVELQKPVSTKNPVSFRISVDDARKRVQTARSACTSRSNVNRSNYNNYCRSPARNISPVFANQSPRKQFDFTQRSQSLFDQSSSRGRRSHSVSLQRTIPRPCSRSPQKAAAIPQLRSQKEVTTGSAKNKNLTSIKRRHTYHHNLIRNGGVNIFDASPDVGKSADAKPEHKEKIESLPDVRKTPVVPKVADKASREYFFNNCLERDKQMEWLEDVDSKIPPVQGTATSYLKGEPISYKVAYTLRMLLFGSGLVSFTTSWREHMLSYFLPNHYTLKFHKDGPVEVMVPLQAYILKHLLFQISEKEQDSNARLSPNLVVQQQLLVTSICDMIWKIGQEKYGVIALPIGTCQFIPDFNYIIDEITEKMELFKFTKRDDLDMFVKQNILKFQDYYSCISLLYSLMLSRGLSQFLEDCSEVKHGVLESSFATSARSRPLVNLCIHGKAVPNNFNQHVEVYNQLLDKVEIRKGIEKRCDFGYLTHREFVDKTLHEVGSCLKTPRYPIWVLNNNGALSILFSLKRGLLSDWKLERRFDLYFFQGIPRHVITSEIDIRLTIDTIQTLVVDNDEEETSTLEETLRTKWEDAVIEWNGYTRF